jgi:hypothetical protein
LSGEQTFCSVNNVKEPLTVWTPTIAPSDMLWYENPDFPELDGKMLLTVLKDKKLIAIELSPDGTQYISQTHYLTNQFGRLRDICVGPDKEIYLATNGASWSNTNPNTHSIIRLKVSNSAAIHETTAKKASVYPNPADEFLNVRVEADFLNAMAVFTDFTGRVIKSFTMEALNKSIPISELLKGTYILKLINQEGTEIAITFVKS